MSRRCKLFENFKIRKIEENLYENPSRKTKKSQDKLIKNLLSQWGTEEENRLIKNQIINNFDENLEADQIKAREDSSSIAQIA